VATLIFGGTVASKLPNVTGGSTIVFPSSGAAGNLTFITSGAADTTSFDGTPNVQACSCSISGNVNLTAEGSKNFELCGNNSYAGSNTFQFPNGTAFVYATSLSSGFSLRIMGTIQFLGTAKSQSVSAAQPSGVCSAGSEIDIAVPMGENVFVTGSPELQLAAGANDFAQYSGGSGTSILTFRYIVQPGDASLALDYTLTNPLFLNGGSIKDSNGNAVTPVLPAPGAPGSLSTFEDISIDTVAPVVSAIACAGPATTNSTILEYSVTFDKPVLGVAAADFTLAGVGVTGTIVSVTGGGATYLVTVSGVSGAGTLGLNLLDNDSITDGAGNPLGGPGAGNGNFTGQAFNVVAALPWSTAGMTFSAAEGQASIAGVVAAFTDSRGIYSAGNYSAQIDWGDGGLSAGTVTYNTSTQQFNVSGNHTYAYAGNWAIQVFISDPTGLMAVADGSATIAAAALTAAPTALRLDDLNAGASVQVASFTDANPGAVASDFAATLSWGTSTCNCTIVSAAGGGFNIYASTTTPFAGSNQPITVTVTDIGGALASVTDNSLVLDSGSTVSLAGLPTNSNLTISNGTTLNLEGTSESLGTVAITSGGIVAGSLSATSYALSNATIGANLSGGAATINNTVTLSGTDSEAVTVNSGATLNIASGTTLTNSGTLTDNGGITIANNGTLTDNGGITIAAGGTFNNASGGVVNENATLTNNGTVSNSGSISVAGTVTISSGDSLTNASGSSLTISGTLTINGTLTQTGGSTTVNSGGTLIDYGTWTINGGTTTIGAGVSAWVGYGGTQGSITGNVVDNGTLDFAPVTSETYSGVISGSGSVYVYAVWGTGAHTLVFTGVNTYTGATTVSYGALQIGANMTLKAVSVASGAALTINSGHNLTTSGTLEDSGAVNDYGVLTSNSTLDVASGAALTNESGGTLTTNSVLTVEGTLTNQGNMNITASSSFTDNGIVTNQSSVTMSAAGVLTIGSSSTGTLTNSGTFNGSNTVNIDAFGSVTNNSGASMFTMTFGNTTNNYGSVTNNGTLTVSGGKVFTNESGGNLTNSSGTLVLGTGYSEINNLSGATLTNNATFTDNGYLVNSGTLTGSGTLTVAANAFIDNFGTLAGNIVVGSGSELEFCQTYNMTYSGVISGAGCLYVNCPGYSISFLNAETYTGTTYISAGTLILGNGTTNGSLASSSTINVSSGATVEFYENANETYSNTISGGGSLTDGNSKAITLSGNHSGFTGSKGTGIVW
jgi:hypothetical protein